MATKRIGSGTATARGRYAKGGKRLGTSYGKVRRGGSTKTGGKAGKSKGGKGSKSNE